MKIADELFDKYRFMTNDKTDGSYDKIDKQKYEFIIKNREKILEAFIAETGLLPSECTMIEQEINDVNFMGTKIYFVKRQQFSV